MRECSGVERMDLKKKWSDGTSSETFYLLAFPPSPIEWIFIGDDEGGSWWLGARLLSLCWWMWWLAPSTCLFTCSYTHLNLHIASALIRRAASNRVAVSNWRCNATTQFPTTTGGSVTGGIDDDAVAQFFRFRGIGHVPRIAATSPSAVASARRPSALPVAAAQPWRLPTSSLVKCQLHRSPLAHSRRAGIGSSRQPVESSRLSVHQRRLRGRRQWPFQSGSAGGKHRRKHEDPRERIPGSVVHFID